VAKRPYHIVTTTIRSLGFVSEYLNHFRQYSGLNQIVFWIIGDRKSPMNCSEEAAGYRDQGLDLRWLDIAAQDKWMARFHDLGTLIPYDSESRRSIGYLMALEEGAHVVISIDDDNFPVNGYDFLGYHAVVGRTLDLLTVETSDGLYNFCERLTLEPARLCYPRGYPFFARGCPQQQSREMRRIRVGINAGLWLAEPDLDATTWLNGPIRAVAGEAEPLALGNATWSPINTQNTAVVRDLLPAYMCVPMGVPIGDLRLERYGDIWSGYFVQAVAKRLGYTVTCGGPLVEHRRNPHNYSKDLMHEFWGMVLLEDIYRLCRETALTSHTARDCYLELAEAIHKMGRDRTDLPASIREYLSGLARSMSVWIATVRQFM